MLSEAVDPVYLFQVDHSEEWNETLAQTVDIEVVSLWFLVIFLELDGELTHLFGLSGEDWIKIEAFYFRPLVNGLQVLHHDVELG